jgi:hypothetical protein
MNEEQKMLHNSIRSITQSLRIYNSRTLSLLKNNAEYLDEVTELKPLLEHLTTWLNKYDDKFKNPHVALIYTIAEGKPFPSNMRNVIERKIDELKILNYSTYKSNSP